MKYYDSYKRRNSPLISIAAGILLLMGLFPVYPLETADSILHVESRSSYLEKSTQYSQSSASSFRLPSLGEMHRFTGYAVFTGVAATVLLGIFAPNPYHGPVAYTTAALAVTNTTLGLIRTGGSLRFAHGAFAFIGTAGLVSNLFLTEKGSDLHKITGALSATSFTVAAVLVLR